MRRALQTTLCLLSYLILLTSCEDEKHKIDVSDIDLDLNITRLDQDWFNMSAVGFRRLHPQYQEHLPEVYKAYIEEVLALGKMNDTDLFASIHRFAVSPEIAEVHDSVELSFSDFESLTEELTDAWKHYKYYFPDNVIPNHATFIGGFSTSYAMTEHELGIGLEMFLGSKCVFYEYLQLPHYLRMRMTKKHLVPWLMKNWLETEYPIEKESPTLLDHMIWEGKVLYALDVLRPASQDSLKIGYSGAQLKWAKDHEQLVWTHFVDNSLLFTTEKSEIAKFTNDGPFTVDLVKESPSRMGYYIGWQIVRAYMDETHESLASLFYEQDSQKILKLSKYRP